MTELFCTIALFTVTRTTPDMSAVKLLQLQTISLAENDLQKQEDIPATGNFKSVVRKFLHMRTIYMHNK